MEINAEAKVKKYILQHEVGWVFTPKHLIGISTSDSIRKALSQLEKQKFIRRIATGIYDYPKQHKTLGTLSPDIDAVARAVAEKNGAKLLPSGAYAANLLGYSEQVPGKVVFLTDGPPKKLKIGNLEIIFRHTTVKNMHGAGTNEALVIQGLKFMKEKHIDTQIAEATKRALKDTTPKQIEKNIKYAPEWIREFILSLFKEKV